MTLYLHGIGHFHPEHEITNRFLEELDIGSDAAWVVERVGIHSRRTVMPLDYIRTTRNVDPRAAQEVATYDNAELGVRAARMALERAGIAASDVGWVVAGGSAPDTASPAEACNVAGRLGIEAPSFDVNSACTSFFVGVHLLASMRPEALPRFVLLVVPEALTKTVDYRDRATAVLWGDGAVAAVLSATEPARATITGTTVMSQPSGSDKVVIPRQGFFRQDGSAVQKFAIKRMTECLRALREKHSDASRKFGFVGHQANLRMLESVCRHCAISDDRHFRNVERFGNTAGAGAPSVISQRWAEWTASDEIGVVGVGAGLTWSGHVLRFGDA